MSLLKAAIERAKAIKIQKNSFGGGGVEEGSDRESGVAWTEHGRVVDGERGNNYSFRDSRRWKGSRTNVEREERKSSDKNGREKMLEVREERSLPLQVSTTVSSGNKGYSNLREWVR